MVQFYLKYFFKIMKNKAFNHFRENFMIYTIFLVALLVHIFFRSPWLEDWDSVQFALGFHQYSVVLHQPHPPGYPLYILMGRFFNLFFQNDTFTLTFMSAVFGSLAILPLYFLTKKMFSKATAVLASLFFIFLPVEWILSEVATSNITGLFFTILLGYLVYTSINNYKNATLIGFIGALALGIRFTDFPVVAALLCLSTVKNHSFKYTAYLITSFIIGVSLWLVPLLMITGPKEFYEAYKKVADYVTWHDTLLGQSYTFKHLMKVRIEYLWGLLKSAYTQIFILISFLSLIIFSLKKKSWQEFRFYFLLVWFFSYFLPLIFFYNLELPQYTLPLLPTLSIITAFIITSFIKNKTTLVLTTFLLTIWLFSKSWPQVINQAQDIPPTISPVLYVKQHFDPRNTLLITTFIYRQFQYYAPEFKNYYGIEKIPSQLQYEYIILDYEGLKGELPILNEYQIIDSKLFTQSYKRSFPRLKETKLYVLSKLENSK